MCIVRMNGRDAAGGIAPDAVRRRIRRDLAASQESRRGVSVLMYACQQGDVDAVRRVINEQPELIRIRDRTGKTAIHYCCTGNHKQGAQSADIILMAAPELVDARDEDGFTPLHLAVIAGNMPLVTFLLASKADINAVDSEKHTVVHWATVCGETEALRAVLAAGAPVSTPDVHGGYPLHYASQMCGGEKDSELGFQVLQTLLAHPDVTISVADGDGRQPLLWAASAGSARAMLSLIRAGAVVEAADKDGLTALHCAASRGHTDCLDTLLTLCGANVDVIDSNGCTALHYAVTLGHADSTALLLAHGANANRQDRKGRSPAHCGCAKGQLETVKMLGVHGANLWLRNARGDLPLHEAAGSGRRDLVKWLLEARPSQVNARNNDGRCPLHLAALNDNADMCKILLDLGGQINPILRTSKNIFMTPLDCALQRGFRSTAKYLQLQGGLPSNRTVLNQTNPPSGLSLQIRDDVTFWGDTSDSERENVNGEEKRRKRSYKRKLAYKYERRASVSDPDLSHNKQVRKVPKVGKKVPGAKPQAVAGDKIKVNGKQSPKEKLTYNSEVKILDHSENINIHQNGSVIINKDIENRPKSARPTRGKVQVKRKTKMDTPDPRRKETVQYETLETSPKKTQQDINDNIKEIESLAHSIEEKAKSICKEVNQIETNIPTATDMHSLTSIEDSVQQNLVVEASVHPPPRTDTVTIIKQDTAYKETIDALKEELESLKNEIKTMKEDGKTIATGETAMEKSAHEVQILKELKDLLEGRMEEIKNTVEEFKVDIKSVMKTNDETTTSKEVDAKKVDEAVTSNKFDETVAIKNADASIITKDNHVNQVNYDAIEIVSQQEEIVNEQYATKKIDAALEKIEAATEDLVAAKEDLGVAKELVTGVSNAEAMGVVAFQVLDTSIELDPKDVQEGDNTEVAITESEIIKTENISDPIIATENVTEIAEIQVESGGVDGKDNKESAGEIKDESVSQIENESTSEQQVIEKKDETKFLKTEKRDHHLHLPRDETVTPQESSIDAKSSDEEAHTSDTSGSSAATKREHKSFTVLEDAVTATRPNRRKDRKPLRKSRSRSEETRMNEEKLMHRRSKIPTALTKTENGRRAKSNLESRIPLLPDLTGKYKTKSETNLAEIYSDEEVHFREESTRKRKTKKKARIRDTKSAGGSDYESSNLIDSGFEPSPRSSRIPKWKNVTDRGVNMASVTQSIQGNIRRYHLERKIFQHLLELKRMQIRAGQHNEAMLVKRAIDTYHRSCAATVGAGRYKPRDFTFKSFEQFLYESLRKIQKISAPEYLKGLPESAIENALLCTQSTNRCMHATHAYTGVPCAAYLPKMDHHSIPKIGFNNCKPQGAFLPDIHGHGKKAVTLELCHGSDKQVISLPTDRLDQNKRYYVTFTVKGQPSDSPPASDDKDPNEVTHRHSKSV